MEKMKEQVVATTESKPEVKIEIDEILKQQGYRIVTEGIISRLEKTEAGNGKIDLIRKEKRERRIVR